MNTPSSTLVGMLFSFLMFVAIVFVVTFGKDHQSNKSIEIVTLKDGTTCAVIDKKEIECNAWASEISK